MSYPFRINDPRIAKAAITCFLVAGLVAWCWFLAGCASPLQRGPAILNGVSNGPENVNRPTLLGRFAYEFLALGNTPVRKDRTGHPIIGGDAAIGFVTKGSANNAPDKTLLTLANYSGFVVLGPGLDWRGMR